MNALGTPDLLSSNRVARQLAAVNADLTRASTELATGLRADPVEAAGGDPTRLYALERDIAAVQTRRITVDLAAQRAGTAQSALARVENAAAAIGVDLAAAAARGDLASAERIGATARDAFETAVSALNARFGERALFAGAGAGPAIAPADDILGEIAARVGAATDAASAVAAIDDYFFSDPTGFETTGYIGSSSDASAVELDDGERLEYAVRADDDAIRATLSALAKSVAAAENFAPALQDAGRLGLFAAASEDALAARENMIAVGADLGIAEERIERAAVRLEAERTVLATARSAIISRDPFEAASAFTAIETQLQTMFAVTSRLSSLTLTNFLR